MQCDERYRSRLEEQRRAAPPTPGLLPATLVRASWCPARAGCRELCFDVAGTSWSWCFPSGVPAEAADDVVLVLRPGAHGLIAESWTPSSASPSLLLSGLDLADAASCVLSGCPVFVHASLLTPQPALSSR